jgi:hypothetical protein
LHAYLIFRDLNYQTGFKAVGVKSGTKFEDIDLREGDWADYDEKVFFGVFILLLLY